MSQYPNAEFLTSAHQATQFVPDTGYEVAFAGRSNAGKSSAINAIIQRRNFARTSKVPGRTQLINFFALGADRRLIDLPGYGYARVSRSVQQHWEQLMTEYFEGRRSLIGLFIIVDARRSLGDFDWHMLDWAERIGCEAHVLLTKADKLKRQPATNTLLQVRKTLGKQASVQLFSALKYTGAEEARDRLAEMLQTP
ncbi:MAG: ribosome biogenesis GTP-binding protein YihA/YsxC [Gammaproteobacteria bacterium]